MNANDRFPTEHGVDRLLSAFFKAELPDPFPMMKAPARAELPMPANTNSLSRDERRTAISNSRLSLAASVALILGGCWYLSGQISAPIERPTVGKGDDSAKIPKEIRKATEDAKKPTMP
jgi:hypothetical protein